MTDETWRAIRERYRRIKHGNLDYTTAMQHDIPLLLQEIERLKGEVARLGPFREFFEKIAQAIEESPAAESDRGLLLAEYERLGVEAGELYEVLRALVRSNLAYGPGMSESFKADLDAAIGLLLRIGIEPADVQAHARNKVPVDPLAGIKITGYVLIGGTLHLYEDAAEIEKYIRPNAVWSQAALIDGVVFHLAGLEARGPVAVDPLVAKGDPIVAKVERIFVEWQARLAASGPDVPEGSP